MAGFLDPKFYNQMQDHDRKAAKKLIFRRLNNSSVRPTSLPSSSTSQATTTKLNALQKLAVACGRILSTSGTTTHSPMTLDEEVSSYIKLAKDKDDFQNFWMTNGKVLPRLSNLVRTVNVIPATSISSEALFSVANYINRKQRSSLSSKTIRYLLVLKNYHLIDELEKDNH